MSAPERTNPWGGRGVPAWDEVTECLNPGCGEPLKPDAPPFLCSDECHWDVSYMAGTYHGEAVQQAARAAELTKAIALVQARGYKLLPPPA